MFDDLSTSELRRRLYQRGVIPEIAEQLITHRDWCIQCRHTIRHLLE